MVSATQYCMKTMPQNRTNQQLTRELCFVSPGALHDVTASGCVGMSKRISLGKSCCCQ